MIKFLYTVLTDAYVRGTSELHYYSATELETGQLVVISIISRKSVGIVTGREHITEHIKYNIKYIESTLDGLKVTENYIKFMRWFAQFNFTNTSNAYRTLFPKGVRSIIAKNSQGAYSPVVGSEPDILLSAEQTNALAAIQKSNRTTLLYGVTGSGKTYVYVKYAYEVAKKGKQVLIVLPELYLVETVHSYITHMLGCEVGIWSSNVSNARKARLWTGVLNGDVKIIIGTRSAIFLPFAALGTIVVDEEHDVSFLETGRSIRYNGRDMCVKLAQLYGAKAILVSATPSLETYYNVKKGNYDLVKLENRHMRYQLPTVSIDKCDTNTRIPFMSDSVLAAIDNRLKVNQGVLVFLNRRGYEKISICKDCKHVHMCDFCSVFLTHSVEKEKLFCHKCDFEFKCKDGCSICGSRNVKGFGVGIEKITLLLKKRIAAIPEISGTNIAFACRDSDTDVIERFRTGEVNLLVATQIVSKCITFQNLSLVVILDIDYCMYSVEFRALEEAYALMHQIIGRAGRTGLKSEAIVSSMVGKDSDLQRIIHSDYFEFAEFLLNSRIVGSLPPVRSIIVFEIWHRDQEKSELAAKDFLNILEKAIGRNTSMIGSIIGPFKPVVKKIRAKYINKVMIQGFRLTLANNMTIRNIVENAIFKNKDLEGLVISLNPRYVY